MPNIFSKWLGFGDQAEFKSEPEPEKRMLENTEGHISDLEASFLRGLGIDPITVSVNAASAMSISTFYSCVRVISDLIAATPYSVLQKGDTGREVKGQHRLHYLIHQRPNARMSPYIFKRTMIANMLVYGFSISQIVRDGSGTPVALIPHPSGRVTILEDPISGMYFFEVKKKDGTVSLVLNEDDVIFLKDLGFDGNCGHSIVKWQTKTLELDLLTKSFAEKYYAKNAFLTGIVTTDIDPKNAEVAKIYRDRLLDSIKSDGSGIAVLGMNATYQPVSRGPVESQVIEFLNQSDKDIAKFFGLPLSMVGDTEKQTSFGTGIESIFIQVTNNVIIPKAIQLEQEVDYKCLTTNEIKQGYYTRFNFRNLLRGDAKTHAEFVTKMIQNGVYNQNEVRAWDEMPAVDGGDQNWIQQNMMPLNKAEEILTSKNNGKGITVPAGASSDN